MHYKWAWEYFGVLRGLQGLRGFWGGDESGEDVEVVVAGLPELAAISFEQLGGLCFEDVDGCRSWVSSGFGEEQVNVLGHQDISEDLELVALA